MWNVQFDDALRKSQIAVCKVQYLFLEPVIVWAIFNSTLLPVTVMHLDSFEVFITGFEQLPWSR